MEEEMWSLDGMTSSSMAFTTHLRVLASSFLRFRDHTGRITVGRTPLDEWSACRRDLYLTTHNTHNRQTSMSPTEFEPAIPADERLQTHALDGTATGIGRWNDCDGKNQKNSEKNLSTEFSRYRQALIKFCSANDSRMLLRVTFDVLYP